MHEFKSSSPEETRSIGKKLPEIFGLNQVYCLYGPLAAGKTTLVKGMAEAINVNRTIVSPSYILLREYEGDTTLYHLDLFRLGSGDEFIEAGLDEYLVDPRGIVAIEWAGRVKEILPEKRVEVEIRISGEGEREIVASANLD